MPGSMSCSDEARNGHSRALVLRGDPGIGKTALLEYAIDRAEGFRVLRAVGIESESKLAFSGLHQLLRPVLGGLDQVPEAAAEALSRSLALAEPGEVNPFLAYAGVLQLLAAAAEREPILAVLDDAHWLDPASAEAITFAARRLEAESVAAPVRACARERRPASTRAASPTCRVEGLSADGGERAARRPRTAVRSRPESRAGWSPPPRATRSPWSRFPATLSDAQRAGTEPLDDPLAVGESVERAFLSRARSLSPEAREALLIAAASDTGDLAAIARACGGSAAALDEAEAAGLVQARGGELSFRHPLVRSAVYSAATAGARREAHLALAEAFGAEDADRRAWHLGAAAVGPDDAVAAALEEAADRARDRGGVGAEARLLERSATLTPDAGLRASRLGRAGWAAFSRRLERRVAGAGQAGSRARPGSADEGGSVRLARRSCPGRRRRTGEHYETFIAEAERVQEVDPLRAARLLWHASGELSLRFEIDRHRQLVERTWSLVDRRRRRADLLWPGRPGLAGRSRR